MSMNRLDAELQQFIRALDGFNESTAQNWDALQRAFESAHQLWKDDDTRRDFERQWGEMGDALRLYRQRHGQAYLDFLVRRKRALDKYFGRG